MSSKRVIFTLAAVGSLLGVSVFAQDAAQKPTGDAVADAARRAREQKKKDTTKPKKVYTDEDLSGLPANSVSTVGQGTATAGTPAEGAANPDGKPQEQSTTADADKNQEKVWRKRFQDAYAKLAQLQKELDVLQREDNKAQLQYYPDPQKAMSEGYSRKDINDKQAKIAEKQKQIDEQKQRISGMEDDLRKAGGDPAWASPQ